MTLTTRTVTNAGDPLCAPDGTPLAGITITFTLSNARGLPIDAWDSSTGERVTGIKTAITDASGEFSVALWPTDRSNTPVQYLCRASLPSVRNFMASLPSGDSVFSWGQLLASGLPLTAQQLDILDTYRAGFDAAAAAAAENAAKALAIFGDAADVAAAVGSVSADAEQVARDKQSANEDRMQTGQDRTATGQDKDATASDRLQTGRDRDSAAESARLAAENGAGQVALAAEQVSLAAEQAGLATSNGAAQVVLAATQAGLSATKAGQASDSAAAALAAQTAINHKYRGGLASDPATRTDGSANVAGDEYFNSPLSRKKVFSGTGWYLPEDPLVAEAINTLAAFNARGAFAGATAYALKDVYVSAGIAYVAVIAHVSTSVAADLAAGLVTVHQGATREDLAASGGAGLVGYNATLNYVAGTLGAQFFGEVNLKSFPWLCALDGVTDDTAGLHAALTFAKARGYRVYHPGGVCRVTSGFTQSTVRHNVAIVGPSRSSDDTNLNLGAMFMLDSTDPDRFFFSLEASSHLFVTNVRFRCAQYVKGSAFFKYSAASFNHRFHSVSFERIDRPHVYKPGAYFQISSFIDVQFNDSGTFHSEVIGGASLGNLLTLVNVSHDGSVPDNSEKIVCNLQGIRGIQTSNFLLEGSLPATGWTVLKLANPYNASWTGEPIFQANGFWSEWTGNSPDFVIDQTGGQVIFNMGTLNLGVATRKYRLSDKAKVSINNAQFTATNEYVNDMFVIENNRCHVVLDQCTLRKANKSDERFTLRDCSISPDGSTNTADLGASLFSNGQSTLVYKWGGGYIDGANAGIYLQSATTYTPSVDATYNRKLSVIPSGNNLSCQLEAKLRGVIAVGTQYNIVALVKLPVFTGGSINIVPVEDNTLLPGGEGYDPTYSGQVVKVNMSRRMSVAVNVVALRATAGGITGMAGNMEIYAFAVYVGNGVPRFEYPAYPLNIVTFNSAAPVAGGWARGDVVWNTAPAASGAPGWVCTAAGTPGTWKAMASLSA